MALNSLQELICHKTQTTKFLYILSTHTHLLNLYIVKFYLFVYFTYLTCKTALSTGLRTC